MLKIAEQVARSAAPSESGLLAKLLFGLFVPFRMCCGSQLQKLLFLSQAEKLRRPYSVSQCRHRQREGGGDFNHCFRAKAVILQARNLPFDLF